MKRKADAHSLNPLAVIFRFLQSGSRVQIWLYNNSDVRFEGKILGFDQFMNIVLDQTYQVKVKEKVSKALGKILVKGENVTLVRSVTDAV